VNQNENETPPGLAIRVVISIILFFGLLIFAVATAILGAMWGEPDNNGPRDERDAREKPSKPRFHFNSNLCSNIKLVPSFRQVALHVRNRPYLEFGRQALMGSMPIVLGKVK